MCHHVSPFSFPRHHQHSQKFLKQKLIHFSLKDATKRWIYGLAANSISTWDDFVKLFLRKYFPNAKTVRVRNEINQFVQLERESFSNT